MKSGENWSISFGEEAVLRLHNFIDVYSRGVKADNPQMTTLVCT